MSDASRPIATIELDAFCEHCGFNLHSQPVWLDERLGLPIARCPECGRHHAAGMRTTPGNAWLRRAALAGLAAWLLVQLVFVASLFGGFVAVQAMASETLMSNGYMTPDGRPVVARNTGASAQYAFDEDATFDLPASQVVYGKRLAPWLAGRGASSTQDDRRYASIGETATVAAFLAVAIVAAASVLASMSWFWRRGLMWLWLALPILSTLLVFALIRQDSAGGRTPFGNGVFRAPPTLELRLAAYVGVALTLATAAGLAVGRAVARLVVSVFIPPRARQLFAFLWHADGRPMPPPRRTEIA